MLTNAIFAEKDDIDCARETYSNCSQVFKV